MKPLGRKSYGSIAHLPGSRLGPGDHRITNGQASICTEKARDRHDFIIVQEKLDGSNVSAARIGDEIVPLTRAGYVATKSPYRQHHLWAKFVRDNESRFADVLSDGERLCGEWLWQSHGTRYELVHEPFVAFDIMRGTTRLPHSEFYLRAVSSFMTPAILSMGGPCSIEEAMSRLGDHGHHGAVDLAEGCVWRVERRGVVDFLAKYVRHDKVDGRYLDAELLNGFA